MMLLRTLASVEVIADCAPMTSLLSRLTSAPVRVRVRVKNATGIRWTWVYTALRRSTIRPSPILDENHRDTRPVTASRTASAAIPPASPTTVAACGRDLPSCHDGVHHPARQHRQGDAHPRPDDREQQEGQQPAAIGLREPPDPADRARPDRPRRIDADRLGDVGQAKWFGETFVEQLARGAQPARSIAVEPCPAETRHELEKPALDREGRHIVRMLDLGGHLGRDGDGVRVTTERQPPGQ